MKKFIYQSKIHPNQRKNCLLIKEKKAGIRKSKNPKAFTNYSQTMDGVYENLQDYEKKKSVNSVWWFDSNKLFLRGIKLNFHWSLYFKVTKIILQHIILSWKSEAKENFS